MKTGNFQF